MDAPEPCAPTLLRTVIKKTVFLDDQERAEVQAILEQLESVHPARAAFKRGVIGTIEISGLVANRGIKERLDAVYSAAVERYLENLRSKK